jgi:hypothetical protein
VVVADNKMRLRTESSSPFLNVSPLEATMKKTLLIAGALLALTASMASAQGGINLSWTDCGSTGAAALTNACTNNAAKGILVGSAIAPAPMDQLNGMAAVLDVQTNVALLSQWWHTETGGCRVGAITGSFDFTGGPFTCADAWAGLASGGISVTPGFNGPNRDRIRLVCAIAGSTAIDDVTENYYFKLSVGGAKSAGTGSCAGCLDGACIVFNSILITQPAGVGDYTLANPILRQFVTWQGGGANVTGGCPQATPTKSATWGSVKSLYR